VRRDMPDELKSKLGRIMKASVEYALQNPESSNGFIKEHSSEMADDIINKHIELYVNQYSRSLGDKGRDAINYLFRYGLKNKIIDSIPPNIFWEE